MPPAPSCPPSLCCCALHCPQVLLAQQQTVTKLMDLINRARAGLVEEVRGRPGRRKLLTI